MKKILLKIDSCITKIIPRYALVAYFVCWIWNSILYETTLFIAQNFEHHDLTTTFDTRVPFIKEYIYIYFGSFIFWYAIYIVIARINRKSFSRLILCDLICRMICMLIYLTFPTTNIRPVVLGTDFSSLLVRVLYSIDAPGNLFPSIHCLLSWLCFISIRREKIKLIYKLFVLIITLSICVSTQVLKQHYIVDCIAAIVLSEIIYFILGFGKLVSKFDKICSRITVFIWRHTHEHKEKNSV